MRFISIKTYFMLLICLVCLQAGAQTVETDIFANQCPQVKSFASVNLWQDGQSLKASSCDFAAKLASVVDSISNWVLVSDKVTLSLKHSASGASYDGVAILSAAEFLYIESSDKVSGTSHLRNEQGNLVTVAHEYGHVILTDWLTKDIPEFKSMREGISAAMIANQKVYFLANQRALIETRLASATTVSYQNYLKKQKQEVEQQLAQAYFSAGDFTPEQNRILNLLAPYHELFADVIAVLYAEDPQAMRKAVEFSGASEKDIYMAQARDFTVKHDLASWNDSTAHFMLSPVRSELYANHWIKNYSPETKREFVKKFYLLLKDEIVNRWQQDNSNVYNVNQKLIERLQSLN